MILLICLTALISNSASREKNLNVKTYYYFCDSHSKDRQELTGKEYILYSKVKKIKCEAEYFTNLAVDWGNKANKECKNSAGCTSDLNWYESFEQANIEFKKIERRYNDTSKYFVKIIDF